MTNVLLQAVPPATAMPSGIRVRPLRRDDAERLRAFVRDLSPTSRHQRFLSSFRELPPALLERLMQVDGPEHHALIAVAIEDGREVVIGEARYALEANGAAEFAIAVADAWQGRGLGRRLLWAIEGAARDAGIRRLFGDTLRGNRG